MEVQTCCHCYQSCKLSGLEGYQAYKSRNLLVHKNSSVKQLQHSTISEGGIQNLRGNSPGYMPRINTVNRSELVGGGEGHDSLCCVMPL